MIRKITNADLSGRNSFGVAARAARLIEFDTAEDLQTLFAEGIGGDWYVLGGGNNTLFTQDYAGTLISSAAREIRVVNERDGQVTVEADAGVEWDDLSRWAVERGLWGIENLSLIPGKAGAAPVQNIGAYGCEVKDVIESVTAFCPESGEVLVLPRERCAFGYRDSVFKRSRTIIVSIRIVLSREARPQLDYGDVAAAVEERGGATLRNIREAICAIRRGKLPDPAVTGNAGSFFKNPVVPHQVAERLSARYPDMPRYPAPAGVKLAAGWLIDRAGLKGFSRGHVGVHPRQALVLVNLGGATGGEVMAFARTIQEKVSERFGVEIEPEVNVL